MRWLTTAAALGLPAGSLWWLAAPGGALYGDAANAEIWLPRELVLGLIGLLLGCSIGWLAARQRFAPGAALKAAAAAGGSFLGSLIAWQSGEALGRWLGPPSDGAAAPHAGFSVLSYGVLAFWPAAVVLTVFAITLASLLRTGVRYPD